MKRNSLRKNTTKTNEYKQCYKKGSIYLNSTTECVACNSGFYQDNKETDDLKCKECPNRFYSFSEKSDRFSKHSKPCGDKTKLYGVHKHWYLEYVQNEPTQRLHCSKKTTIYQMQLLSCSRLGC